MSEEIKKVISDTENIENPDKIDKFVDAEAEKLLVLFKQTFNEHHEKKLKEEIIENNMNLDCEDGLVTDILIKIAKRIRESI